MKIWFGTFHLNTNFIFLWVTDEKLTILNNKII